MEYDRHERLLVDSLTSSFNIIQILLDLHPRPKDPVVGLPIKTLVSTETFNIETPILRLDQQITFPVEVWKGTQSVFYYLVFLEQMDLHERRLDRNNTLVVFLILSRQRQLKTPSGARGHVGTGVESDTQVSAGTRYTRNVLW